MTVILIFCSVGIFLRIFSPKEIILLRIDNV